MTTHHSNPVLDVGVGVTLAFGRRAEVTTVLDLATVGPHDRVADIGCGPGVAARAAAARGAEVVGIDPSAAMLGLARVLGFGRSARITYRQGRAESTGLDDASVTVVCAIASAHHWSDLDAGLTEAARVLAPGGRIVILEAIADGPHHGHHGHHGFDADSWTAVAHRLDAIGFSDVATAEHELRRHRFVSVRGTRA